LLKGRQHKLGDPGQPIFGGLESPYFLYQDSFFFEILRRRGLYGDL